MRLSKFLNIKTFLIIVLLIISIFIYYLFSSKKYVEYIKSYSEYKLQPVLGENELQFGDVKLTKDNLFFTINIKDIRFIGNNSLYISFLEIKVRKGLFGLFYKFSDVGMGKIEFSATDNSISHDTEKKNNLGNDNEVKQEGFKQEYDGYENALDYYVSKGSKIAFNTLDKIFFNLNIDSIKFNDTFLGSISIHHYYQKNKKDRYLEGTIRNSLTNFIKLHYDKDDYPKIVVTLNNFSLNDDLLSKMLLKYKPEWSDIIRQNIDLNIITTVTERFNKVDVQLNLNSVTGNIGKPLCNAVDSLSCNIDYGSAVVKIDRGTISVNDLSLKNKESVTSLDLVYGEYEKTLDFYLENIRLGAVLSYWPNYQKQAAQIKEEIFGFIDHVESKIIKGSVDFITGNVDLNVPFHSGQTKEVKDIIPVIENLTGNFSISGQTLKLHAYEDIPNPVYSVDFIIPDLYTDGPFQYEVNINSEGDFAEHYQALMKYLPFYFSDDYAAYLPVIKNMKNLTGIVNSVTALKFYADENEKYQFEYSINIDSNNLNGYLYDNFPISKSSFEFKLDNNDLFFVLNLKNDDTDLAILYRDNYIEKKSNIYFDGYFDTEFIIQIIDNDMLGDYKDLINAHDGIYSVNLKGEGRDLMNMKYKGVLDLKNVDINYPEISYSKIYGKPAKVKMDFGLQEGVLKSSVFHYTAHAADIEVNVNVDKDDYLIHSNRVKFADNDLHFTFSSVKNIKDLKIFANIIDIAGLSKFFKRIDKSPDFQERHNVNNYRIDAEIKKAIMFNGNHMSNLKFKFDLPKRNVLLSGAVYPNEKADFWYQKYDEERALSYISAKYNGRDIVISSTNAGILLSALDISEYMFGGNMELFLKISDNRSIKGDCNIDNFYLGDSPTLARIFALTSFNISNISGILRGKGVSFNSFYGRFSFADGLLTIEESWAKGAALAIFNFGIINSITGDYKMYGSLVPYYQLSVTVSLVPLIGNIFTDDQTRGLITLEYVLEASKDEDSMVQVDTNTSTAPSFLRKFIDIFGDGSLSNAYQQ
ncbi:AsmA-like C-terminal region-containing protein [Anaplasmataceae bacterium AB001_6]|nr:AsmA-like C-terminal region-containing protein [Anaplasmataceae bacterium AB001_6]